MLDAEAQAEVMEGVSLVANTPKLMQILDAVEAVYKIGKLDIMSLRRFPHLVEPRDAFCWLARTFTVRTFAEVGKFLADRDHTTVWDAVRRVEANFEKHAPKMKRVAERLGIDPARVRP